MIRFSKLLIKTLFNKAPNLTIIPHKFQIQRKILTAIPKITTIEIANKEIIVLEIVISEILIMEITEYLKNSHQINTELWLKRKILNRGLLLRNSKSKKKSGLQLITK
jgi:hypothetical protein